MCDGTRVAGKRVVARRRVIDIVNSAAGAGEAAKADADPAVGTGSLSQPENSREAENKNKRRPKRRTTHYKIRNAQWAMGRGASV